MQAGVLASVSDELNRTLGDGPVLGVRETAGGALALLLERRSADAGARTAHLVLDSAPSSQALFQARGALSFLRAGESELVRLAAAKLAGRRLTRVWAHPGDRIVELCFEGGARLVGELTGGRGQTILVGEDGLILATSRPDSAGLRLTAGAAWAAPVRRAAPPASEPAAASPEERAITPDPTWSAAIEADWTARSQAALFAARRSGLAAILEKERARIGKLVPHLEGDLAALPAPGAHRREAEALLAGLARARREGEWVEVPDPYAPEGPALRIRTDPAMPLQENADALFERERKTERGRETVASRLAMARERRDRLLSVLEQAGAAQTHDDLDRVESGMNALGLLIAPGRRRLDTRSKKARAAAGPNATGEAPALAGIRRFVSSDGLEILAGKTSRENDRLTFRIAGPEDFWFHAADAAGAHVVVRNPGGLAHLPAKTLHEAAAVAAHYSKSGGGGRVEVHATRRKYVRKSRGAPAGQVLLKKFTSLRVAPGLPPGAREEP